MIAMQIANINVRRLICESTMCGRTLDVEIKSKKVLNSLFQQFFFIFVHLSAGGCADRSTDLQRGRSQVGKVDFSKIIALLLCELIDWSRRNTQSCCWSGLSWGAGWRATPSRWSRGPKPLVAGRLGSL